jgi:hypothetical protein
MEIPRPKADAVTHGSFATAGKRIILATANIKHRNVNGGLFGRLADQ